MVVVVVVVAMEGEGGRDRVVTSVKDGMDMEEIIFIVGCWSRGLGLIGLGCAFLWRRRCAASAVRWARKARGGE